MIGAVVLPALIEPASEEEGEDEGEDDEEVHPLSSRPTMAASPPAMVTLKTFHIFATPLMRAFYSFRVLKTRPGAPTGSRQVQPPDFGHEKTRRPSA